MPSCLEPPKLDACSEDLVLRICNSSRAGQVLRLRSDKCTIGSGPRCTLRLRARAVQPLHCLVVRGPRANVVRCWGPDTRLNGRRFTDAPLVAGDRLSIGPVELEILGVQAPAPPAAAQASPPAPPPHGPAGETSDAERKRLDAERSALDAERKRLDAERSALDAERTEFDQQRQQAQSRLAETQAMRHEFEQQRHRWEIQKAAAETELNQRARQLDARAAQIEEAQKRLEEQRRQWLAEQAEAEQKLQQWTARLEAREAAREASEAATEVRFEPVASRPPVTSAEVFRKAGIAPVLEDAEQQQSQPAPRVSTGGTAARQQPEPRHDEQDEESVDQYMARLLARVRSAVSDGEGRVSEPGPAVRPSDRSAGPPQADASEPASPCGPVEGAASKRTEPVEMSPRAVAAEKSVDLTVLREVANLSAQHAIGRHSRRQRNRAVGGKLVVALFALVAAAYLAATWWFGDGGDWALYAGALALSIAMLWLHYALRVRRQWAGRPADDRRQPPCSRAPEVDAVAPRGFSAP